MKSAEERYWSKVDKSGECWEWTDRLSEKGYGTFWTGSRFELSHRVAYGMEAGSIPSGMSIDHTCHNRACVRPEHLRVVTNKQNHENRAGANRNNHTSGIRGVSWHKRSGKWQAKIGHDSRQINLGLFADVAAAEEAVIAKRLELFTHNELDKASGAAP